MYIVACDANCKSCATNGKGKCDDGQCDAKYALDATAKTCGGEYILVYFLSNVGIICQLELSAIIIIGIYTNAHYFAWYEWIIWSNGIFLKLYIQYV